MGIKMLFMPINNRTNQTLLYKNLEAHMTTIITLPRLELAHMTIRSLHEHSLSYCRQSKGRLGLGTLNHDVNHLATHELQTLNVNLVSVECI